MLWIDPGIENFLDLRLETKSNTAPRYPNNPLRSLSVECVNLPVGVSAGTSIVSSRTYLHIFEGGILTTEDANSSRPLPT